LRFPEPIAVTADSAVLAGSASELRPRAALRRWLTPDLALTASLATLFYLLFLFGGSQSLFHDADAGWHIRAGERLIEAGSLPRVDPFSFSRPGQPWVEWEWGADAITAAAHSVAGLGGVVFLYALSIAACVWLWFRLNWAAGGNFLIAALFAAPMLSTVNLHWLARPHVLGWLFLVGAVWFCERMPRRITAGMLVRVALFSAAWANVHGSFFLGPVVAIVYGVGIWCGRILWDSCSVSPRNYFAAAGAALAGSLINPYGWNLHVHVVSYLNDSALLDRIGEFQSFNFHADGAAQIVAALLIAIAGGCAALAARRPERFLLAMLLTAGALRSARMLPVAALVLLPLANGSVTELLERVQLRRNVRARLDGFLAYSDRLRALDSRMSGLALLPLVALALIAVIPATRPAFPPDQFPVAASAAVAALPADARIFSSDKFGGYLIYRFSGERKVYFDGRSDFYGAAFLKQYALMMQARPGWRGSFDAERFTHALLPPDAPVTAALTSAGWHELYRDRVAVLLARSL
jgi:hypothetical protein